MKKGNIPLLLISGGFLLVFLCLFIGRTTMPVHTASISGNATQATDDPAYLDGKININQAGISELVQLPGIGEGIARNIVEYRNEHGPFRSVEELLEVEGIGPKRLDGLIDYITVGG